MKNQLLFCLALMGSLFSASAYNFEVEGIYYNFINESEVEVTFQQQYQESYSGDVIIPSTVDYNGKSYAVTSIGEFAFAYNAKLTSVDIPISVTKLDIFSFYKCSALKEIKIPELVKSIGRYSFVDCTELNTLYFNARKCDDLLYGMRAMPYTLKKIIFGNEVESIPGYICAVCIDLETVIIGKSVTKIGEHAFHRCEALQTVVLPPSLKTIDYCAFSSCSALRNINIPASVIYIGEGAFNKCDVIDSIIIPEGISEIKNWTFSDCQGLTSVTIPSSVILIGEEAFYNCNNLKEFIIPDGVTDIDSYAFWKCNSLKEITIPNSVKNIADYAFCNCYNLMSAKIGDSVTDIGVSAFSNCKLKNLIIGKSVEKIYSHAFSSCNDLEIVHSYAITPPECNTTVFPSGQVKNITLYVPTGTKNDYSTAEGWKDFGTIIDNLDGIENTEQDLDERAYRIEYYNLNGVKVDGCSTPLTPGLYIIKHGNKSEIVRITTNDIKY